MHCGCVLALPMLNFVGHPSSCHGMGHREALHCEAGKAMQVDGTETTPHRLLSFCCDCLVLVGACVAHLEESICVGFTLPSYRTRRLRCRRCCLQRRGLSRRIRPVTNKTFSAIGWRCSARIVGLGRWHLTVSHPRLAIREVSNGCNCPGI